MPAPDIPGIDLRRLFPDQPVYYWGESVLNIRLAPIDFSDFPVGESITRARALAKSSTFLSVLAQQTADRETRTISVKDVGIFEPSNQKELPVAAQQAQAKQAAQVRTARFESGRPAQVACNY